MGGLDSAVVLGLINTKLFSVLFALSVEQVFFILQQASSVGTISSFDWCV